MQTSVMVFTQDKIIQHFNLQSAQVSNVRNSDSAVLNIPITKGAERTKDFRPIRDDLSIACAEKSLKKKQVQRVSGSNNYQYPTFIDTIDVISKTINSAYKHFTKGEYQLASTQYLKALDYPGINSLQERSYLEVLKELYQCQIELWGRECDPNKRKKLVADARHSLEAYLERGSMIKNHVTNNQKLHLDFASRLFFSALEEKEKIPLCAFNHFKHVIEVDLKYSIYINSNEFNEIIDEILYHMTDCITRQEAYFSGASAGMEEILRGIIKNTSIEEATRNKYEDWLDQAWQASEEPNHRFDTRLPIPALLLDESDLLLKEDPSVEENKRNENEDRLNQALQGPEESHNNKMHCLKRPLTALVVEFESDTKRRKK